MMIQSERKQQVPAVYVHSRVVQRRHLSAAREKIAHAGTAKTMMTANQTRAGKSRTETARASWGVCLGEEPRGGNGEVATNEAGKKKLTSSPSRSEVAH